MIGSMPTLSITLPEDITSLDDDALQSLFERADVLAGKLYTLKLHISTLLEAGTRQDELNVAVLEALGVEDGAKWRQPKGGHDAYPKEMTVEWKGKRWQSLMAGNVWEPGVSAWRELVAVTDAPADWVQPTGAHDAYNTGDAVSFNKEVYESVMDGNVWSPTDYPQGWKKITGTA